MDPPQGKGKGVRDATALIAAGFAIALVAEVASFMG